MSILNIIGHIFGKILKINFMKKMILKKFVIFVFVIFALNLQSQVIYTATSNSEQSKFIKLNNDEIISPNYGINQLSGDNESKGDLIIEFNYPTDRLATYGCDTDGDHFFVACHHPSYAPAALYRFDKVGNYVDSTILKYDGTTAMTYDGEYFFTTGQLANVFHDRKIYIWDFTNNFHNPEQILFDSILFMPPDSLVWEFISMNFMTYSPDDDAFWIGSWTKTMLLVDREGEVLDAFSGVALGQHNLTGAIYDNETPGGPYLWAADIDNKLIRQYHLPSKTYTGNSYSYTPETNSSGEMFLNSDLVTGKRIMGLYSQSGAIIGYDLDGSINVNNYDLAVNKTLVELYNVKNSPIEVITNITNNGLETISSFDYYYQINGGEIKSMSVSTNLASFESLDFTHDIQWIPEEGVSYLKVWAANPNGHEDQNPENDTINELKYIYNPEAKRKRVVLHEEFTSSTCGPCVGATEHLQELFGNNSSDDFTFVAYQMNWPGSGDIYYDPTGGGIRKNFYDVGGIPHMNVEGEYYYPTSYSQSDFDSKLADSAFLEIQANWNLNGEEITVNVDLIPSFPYPENHNLYVTVIENKTVGNVGTNGQTEFHNVEMKMIPNGNGYALPEMQSGETISANFTESLSNTNVEEWDDLAVIVWVQNFETTEVLQSSWAILGSGQQEQEIALEFGFSFVSTRIIHENPDMLTVLEPILNDNLDFIRNSDGQTLRKIGPNWVNGIGDWSTTEGYLFKMNASEQIIFQGEVIDPLTQIELYAGFQFVSYLPETSGDALEVFENILSDNLIFIRNSNGNTLRKIGPNWVNGLGIVNAGEGFLIKMNADDILIYNVPVGEKLIQNKDSKCEYFKFENGNPAEDVYTIYIDGLEIGDEVAAYKGNTILGSTIITSENLYSNDMPVFSVLNEGQGYIAGEPILLKVWSNGEEAVANFEMKSIYDSYVSNVYPANDGKFSFVKITKNLAFLENTVIFPNPTTDIINISSSVKINNVVIYNYVGQRVYEGKSTKINTSKLDTGVYIIRIETVRGIQTHKLTLK